MEGTKLLFPAGYVVWDDILHYCRLFLMSVVIPDDRSTDLLFAVSLLSAAEAFMCYTFTQANVWLWV